MAVGVTRSPMDPATFRFWALVGRIALIAGLIGAVAASALTLTGHGREPYTTVIWLVVLACAVAFIVNATVSNTRWSPSSEEVAALARSGGPAERSMVAGWRGTPAELLAELSEDRDDQVARTARANLRRRGQPASG